MRMTWVVVLLMAAGGCATARDSDPSPLPDSRLIPSTSQLDTAERNEAVALRPEWERMAYDRVPSAVSAHLLTPATAIIHRPLSVSASKRGEILQLQAFGEIDSQNVFGAMLRDQYSVTWEMRLGFWDLSKVTVGSKDYHYLHGIAVQPRRKWN